MLLLDSLLPYMMATVCLAILLLNRIRVAIALLLTQYILAFTVSFSTQPLRTVLSRLIGGALVCLILYSSQRRFTRGLTFIHTDALPRSPWFRMITSMIVVLVAIAIAFQSNQMVATFEANIFLGAMINLCMGALMLGLYQTPIEAAIGLLTLLIGFDLFYGAIEPSLAIVALLISIQVIIALATSYIMSITHNKVIQEEVNS
jgi:hypothetical protein